MQQHVNIELTIREAYQQPKSVAINIEHETWCQMTSPVEISNDPYSLMFAGFEGGEDGLTSIGNAIAFRKKQFTLRKEYAAHVANALTDALIKKFGVNDKLDGYSIDKMSDQERKFHKSRGRL